MTFVHVYVAGTTVILFKISQVFVFKYLASREVLNLHILEAG